AIIVQAVLHDGPARRVEFVQRYGQPDRSMSSSNEGQRVGVVRFEQQRKHARLRRPLQRIELVQADKRGTAKFTSPFLEQRGRTADIRPIDEDGLAVAAQ